MAGPALHNRSLVLRCSRAPTRSSYKSPTGPLSFPLGTLHSRMVPRLMSQPILNNQEPAQESRVRDSISVQISGVLILVYVLICGIGGNLLALNFGNPTVILGCPSWNGVASYLVQNNCLVME